MTCLAAPMTDKKKPARSPDDITRRIDTAPEAPRPATPADPSADAGSADVQACSELDHSDTDNGRRLIVHFGGDLVVMAQQKAARPLFVAWAGTHWDVGHGGPAARALAQKVGGRIVAEADFLTQTPSEEKAIEKGLNAQAALDLLDAEIAAIDKPDIEKTKARGPLLLAIAEGKAAREELNRRKVNRRKFGISSKNNARLEAMLACAAPHIMRQPEAFNADPLLVVTKGHTLRFTREIDLECPDETVTRHIVGLDVVKGHRREDLATKVLPVLYDPQATCPKFEAFLQRFLPVADVREFVQTFSGLGLLGMTVQRILFHYGDGANGKSVFMETLVRVLGDYAVGLAAEAIAGNTERSAGAASPDLVRLDGVRMLRVLELPADKALDESLIKKLTGGEAIPVRDLFAGYYEFTPVFSGHMSGNGYPRVDGTDNGIWRRLSVVHWPVTLAEDEQREFEDVLAEFEPEYPGILNWLIEGARRFLAYGLHVPDAVKAATKEYRDEMDPVGEFIADCLERCEGHTEKARDVYQAYVSWCMANAKKPVFETKFGRVMKNRFHRDDGRVRHYLDCRIHDVPDRPDVPRNP